MTTQSLSNLFAVALFVSSVLLTVCGNGERERAAILNKAAEDLYEVALIDGYYSSDVKTAEESLLGLAQLYSGSRFAHVDGIEGTRALTETRLYLLYSQTRRTNEATLHRSGALKLYPGGPGQTEEERWTELLYAVERLDRHREVKWKLRK